jgi:hypothetical protein
VALKIVRDEPFKENMMWKLWGEYPVKLKDLLKNVLGFKRHLKLKIIEFLLDRFSSQLEEFLVD